MELYKIDRMLSRLDVISDTEAVDTETGEIFPIEVIEGLKMSRKKKIENVAKWTLNLEADVKSYKDREAEFKERRERTERKIESLKRYLEYALQGENYEAKDKSVAVNFRKTEKVNILDMKLIPAELFRVKDPEVNKAEIKKLLKAGQTVPGCEIEQGLSMKVR